MSEFQPTSRKPWFDSSMDFSKLLAVAASVVSVSYFVIGYANNQASKIDGIANSLHEIQLTVEHRISTVEDHVKGEQGSVQNKLDEFTAVEQRDRSFLSDRITAIESSRVETGKILNTHDNAISILKDQTSSITATLTELRNTTQNMLVAQQNNNAQQTNNNAQQGGNNQGYQQYGSPPQYNSHNYIPYNPRQGQR